MDISALSFEKWIKFIFDHPVEETPWHFDDEWSYEVQDPLCVLKHLVRLFKSPETVLGSFTKAQVDQGFWFLPGPNGLMWTIISPSIPWADRKECIQAIFDLFDKFLGSAKLESATYMWWDSLITYCSWEDQDIVSSRVALKEIVSVMRRLHGHPLEDVRSSADHGLDHLKAIAGKEKDAELLNWLGEE